MAARRHVRSKSERARPSRPAEVSDEEKLRRANLPKEPEEIIQFVKWLTPAFGGVNLEDIAQPKCFGILERLRKETDIAVWHDDQQGTATINVAGVFSALKVVGKKLPNVTIALVGS